MRQPKCFVWFSLLLYCSCSEYTASVLNGEGRVEVEVELTKDGALIADPSQLFPEYTAGDEVSTVLPGDIAMRVSSPSLCYISAPDIRFDVTLGVLSAKTDVKSIPFTIEARPNERCDGDVALDATLKFCDAFRRNVSNDVGLQLTTVVQLQLTRSGQPVATRPLSATCRCEPSCGGAGLLLATLEGDACRCVLRNDAVEESATTDNEETDVGDAATGDADEQSGDATGDAEEGAP